MTPTAKAARLEGVTLIRDMWISGWLTGRQIAAHTGYVRTRKKSERQQRRQQQTRCTWAGSDEATTRRPPMQLGLAGFGSSGCHIATSCECKATWQERFWRLGEPLHSRTAPGSQQATGYRCRSSPSSSYPCIYRTPAEARSAKAVQTVFMFARPWHGGLFKPPVSAHHHLRWSTA